MVEPARIQRQVTSVIVCRDLPANTAVKTLTNVRTVLVRMEGHVSTNQGATSANVSADTREKIAKTMLTNARTIPAKTVEPVSIQREVISVNV